MNFKFKEGDRVLYEGLIGVVESCSSNGTFNSYGLVSEVNEELTCTAKESECELVLEDDEIDQSEGLENANYASQRIQNMVGGMTDKYYRDGCH